MVRHKLKILQQMLQDLKPVRSFRVKVNITEKNVFLRKSFLKKALNFFLGKDNDWFTLKNNQFHIQKSVYFSSKGLSYGNNSLDKKAMNFSMIAKV